MTANPGKPRGGLAKTGARKARPDAEGERRTVRRRAPRLRMEACKTKDRRVTRRAVPLFSRKGGHFFKNSGAFAPREQRSLPE